MSIDWYVLLSPIVLVIVALPLLFVGCAKFTAEPGSPPKDDPHPPPRTTPPGSSPPLVPIRVTTFRLEMDRSIEQVDDARRPIKIDVVFRLTSSTGAVAQVELPQPHRQITTTKTPPPNPPLIDPATDPGVWFSIVEADLGVRDRASCVCTVTLPDGSTDTVGGSNKQAAIITGRTYEFRIQRRANTNRLDVYLNGA
jgi:hypothetical protein